MKEETGERGRLGRAFGPLNGRFGGGGCFCAAQFGDACEVPERTFGLGEAWCAGRMQFRFLRPISVTRGEVEVEVRRRGRSKTFPSPERELEGNREGEDENLIDSERLTAWREMPFEEIQKQEERRSGEIANLRFETGNVSSTDERKDSGKRDLSLFVENENAKKGKLLRNQCFHKVSIIHKSPRGDVLVHDGTRTIMIPKESVLPECENSAEFETKISDILPIRVGDAPKGDISVVDLSDSEGRRRLALVRMAYRKFVKGELETQWLLQECKRYGFLR